MSSNKIMNLKNIRKIRDINSEKLRCINVIENLDTNDYYYEIILDKKFETEDEAQEFSSSINTISKISSHPSLLQIIKYIDQPIPTILAKYMPNGLLSDLIEKMTQGDIPNFTGTKKFIILLGLSIGMRFFYFNYIFHGTLSPNKIFLDENFYPHILNYEITKDTTDEENYLKRIQSQSDDVYSFSLIAYEIITSKKLPEGKQRPDLTLIKNDWVRHFLQKCLSHDSFRKPFFYKIYKRLLKKKGEFETVLGEIDITEVNIYLMRNERYLSTFSEKVKFHSDQGELTALTTYGLMLFNGYGLKEDKRAASEIYRVVAEHGRTNIMYYLGVMYENGDGIPKDSSLAVRYYKMAADMGHPDAMNSYGLMLESGQGTEMDKAEAARCYKTAAGLGNIVSMSNYGYMLSKGIGVDMDKAEASRYYKMAADLGNTRGMLCYGAMLSIGDGIQKDAAEGARYLEMAAYQGNPEAMFGYAAMLDEGNGVGRNKSEATRYFKMAADKGRPYAIYEYGIRLFFGEGIQKNKEEAVKYIRTAGEKGHLTAMFAYGTMLEYGEGCTMDKFEAARFYKMAAYLGHEKAGDAYKHLSKYLNFSL